MKMSRLLNPLQWNFGPRTTATLVTWAILPVTITGFVVYRSFGAAAQEAGLSQAQIELLTGRMLTATFTSMIPLTIVAILASVLFAYVVVKPLWRLSQGMARVGQGDLSHPPLRVDSADEVGQITGSFNQMAEQLKGIVRTMANTASALDGAVGQLESSSMHSRQATESTVQQIDLVRETAEQQAANAGMGTRAIRELQDAAGQVASGAQAQAVEVSHAAETVRQMATAIEQVAHSASVVAEAAASTRRAADDGGQKVRLSAEGMDQVSARVLDAAEKLRHLSQSLQQVDEILQLITEIAGQTDLLALNAAIEAARVGEHGKGFAVVAGEVRRLAERVRTAAGEIGGRVEGLRLGANAVVETMEAGTQDVQRGVLLSREAGEALDRILGAVAETQAQVESISAASEEIAAASAQVVNATVQLSAIAEENAATAEQMLSSAHSVTDLIAGVESDARKSQGATATMAASSVQVSASVEEMGKLAAQVAAMAGDLHKQAGSFRF